MHTRKVPIHCSNKAHCWQLNQGIFHRRATQSSPMLQQIDQRLPYYHLIHLCKRILSPGLLFGGALHIIAKALLLA
jgi:hypothetical protein